MGERAGRGCAQVQMAALQAQQLAWQQENLAARLAGLRAAASQSELNQALKARAAGYRAVGAWEVRNKGPRLARLGAAAMQCGQALKMRTSHAFRWFDECSMGVHC